MIQIRNAAERGHANHGWLDTRHTFSFADYFDPDQMGFSVLRVINEDRVAPGAGFPTHAHRDMEIITYPLQGALEHRDNMGNGSVIRPGDAQRMSAGTGVSHSEFNASSTEPVHFLQIWIQPASRGITPSYEQRSFPVRKQGLRLIASPDGTDGSLLLHQDVRLYVALLEPDETIEYPLEAGRRVYIHLARGELDLNGKRLEAGDGARAWGENITLLGKAAGSEALLFDLP